jgi:transposase-like protein
MDVFSAAHFRNDDTARKCLEAILWPDGPVCPKCGVVNHAYATRKPGVFRCAESKCRKDFTVTMNTVMERSHIALHKWLQAFHLMTASKKGISAHQLHRTLDITYEAAWFMTHRIRESMRTGGLAPMGGGGKVVEADETYYGKVEKPRHPAKPYRKGRRGPMDIQHQSRRALDRRARPDAVGLSDGPQGRPERRSHLECPRPAQLFALA